MSTTISVTPSRVVGQRSPMLYGHFIEHFHRQIYGGVYQPGHPLADEDGLRTDVLDAMRKIRVPILRWPGGCFVSAYHWKEAVGPERTPMFDKAWRVEDPNTFGTDEYVKLCRKIGCEPYICTNAGTGAAEEMSDWMEYCNLDHEGKYARWRIANGYREPHNVKYWSIGNENYGFWEIGAKTAEEWGVLVREAAKMLRHVDPTAELTAAALSDPAWNMNLLTHCAPYLDWISIHEYFDMVPEENCTADYEGCMAFTEDIDHSIREVRGMLAALKLDKKIRIAFDEWNLRSWHHPKALNIVQGLTPEEYLYPRDKNDLNETYTMADAVFTACFLNAMNRNCDIVGMANFAPIVNTRGCIYTHDGGIVLRSTYHVFDLYVNRMGDTVVDLWAQDMPKMDVRHKQGHTVTVDALDLLATTFSDRAGMAVAAVNKHPDEAQMIRIPLEAPAHATLHTLNGESKDSYNDVGREDVRVRTRSLGLCGDCLEVVLEPHSVNVIEIG